MTTTTTLDKWCKIEYNNNGIIIIIIIIITIIIIIIMEFNNNGLCSGISTRLLFILRAMAKLIVCPSPKLLRAIL